MAINYMLSKDAGQKIVDKCYRTVPNVSSYDVYPIITLDSKGTIRNKSDM